MSLEQLKSQIEVATMAMEKAAKSSNKSTKSKLKLELSRFRKVLEKSKQRLRELEMVTKQCDDLSIIREHSTRETSDPAEKVCIASQRH
jgi:ribosomal protein L3